MYLNSIQIIGFVGKDPERRQRRCIRRSVGCHATVVEERAGRVVLKDRVAPRRRVERTRRARCGSAAQGRSRPSRRHARQHDLRP